MIVLQEWIYLIKPSNVEDVSRCSRWGQDQMKSLRNREDICHLLSSSHGPTSERPSACSSASPSPRFWWWRPCLSSPDAPCSPAPSSLGCGLLSAPPSRRPDGDALWAAVHCKDLWGGRTLTSSLSVMKVSSTAAAMANRSQGLNPFPAVISFSYSGDRAFCRHRTPGSWSQRIWRKYLDKTIL